MMHDYDPNPIENDRLPGHPSVDFDYDAIDGVPEGGLDKKTIANGIYKVIKWVNEGDGAVARAVRALAVEFHFGSETQADLAKRAGVTKAAVSKAANKFRDDFGLDDSLMRTPRMRSPEIREKFSKQCKQRHQKRNSQSSQASQTKSTTTTPTLYDLVRQQSQMVMPQCRAPLSAGNP